MRSTYVANWLGRAVNVVSNGNTRNCKQNIHSLNSNSSTILNDHLVNLGVAGEIQVGVDSAGGMDVCVGAVAAPAGLGNKNQ